MKKMLKAPDSIVCEEIIPSIFNSWDKDALLLRVNNGSGKLITKYGMDNSGEPFNVLMLDNKPLINSFGYELYCPTCAKVLSIGLGRGNATTSLIDKVKDSQEVGNDLSTAFEKVKPLLSILENGYYLMSYIEMIPTNGEGEFFWNLSTKRRAYNASADVFYKYHSSMGVPKFILPSQRIDCLNIERVNEYREQIKNGKIMTGLAYYYEGFMSTLIDGHHRATAAYIENKTIECLTILKVSGYGIDSHKPKHFYVGSKGYEFNFLKNNKKVYKNIKKDFSSKKAELTAEEIQTIIEDCEKIECEREDLSDVFGRKNYPDYLAIAFGNMAGDVSEGRIAELLFKRDDESEFELEMVLKKLQLVEPARAFNLSRRILKDPNWRILWQDVFGYLATIDSVEVEDIFIQYEIENEYDPRDNCRLIADEYLRIR